jgi:methionyl-tRNA synthetase
VDERVLPNDKDIVDEMRNEMDERAEASTISYDLLTAKPKLKTWREKIFSRCYSHSEISKDNAAMSYEEFTVAYLHDFEFIVTLSRMCV